MECILPRPRQSFWQFLSLLAARVQQLFVHSSAQSAENIQAAAALDAYGDCILRLAYSYLRNMSDAEDVLQETMIRYLRGHPAFESDSHEKAWLLRVAINLSRNRIDYNARRAHADLDDHLLEKSAPDLAFVWDAVKTLPPQYAEAVHLYYQEGYSCDEIARLLDKNESTVRTLLRRARMRLKDVLKEEYDFEV